MLSGVTASWALAYFLNQNSPSAAQITGAGFIVVALGFLSPLHHFDRVLAKLKAAWARLRPQLTYSSQSSPLRAQASSSPRLILFVCSGNTCRSPMAAAIAKTEIAARFGIPFENVDRVSVKAMSAGVSAKVGEPMTSEAKQALHQLGFHPNGHRARDLTVELAAEAEQIFCMTQAHRAAVLDLIPAGADKTACLDPNTDVEDPIGGELGAYLDCASRLHHLVQLRFDELGLPGHAQI
jgi:protein-tyrosine-phosphatase